MITIYGRATSSNVQAVMWGIAELGLAYERLDYGHVYGGLDTAAFRALTPHARVPVIRDGDLVVWESCAILRYLASVHGDGGAFWPAGPGARARVDMWAEWAKIELCARFTTPIFWTRVRTAAADRDAGQLGAAIADFERMLATLEAQIGKGPYILGAAFTLADVIAGHLMFRYHDIDIPRADLPGIAAWYERLKARPAFAEHVMVDYAPLRHPEAG